jgi:acyl dehydratase
MPEPRHQVTAARIYFEDAEEGMIFTTGERVIAEADLISFAEISGDFHPIHLDPAYAAKTNYGQRIAHGPMGIAIALGLFGTIPQFKGTTVVMTDVAQWSFRKPIFIGTALHLVVTLGSKRITRSGHGIVERSLKLQDRRGLVLQEGHSAVILVRRVSEPAQ